MRRATFPVIAVILLLAAQGAAAFVPSDAVKRATVMVVCDGRKGSGTVTQSAFGYIVTGGHIAIDSQTGEVSEQCTVRFPLPPEYFAASIYLATVVHAVYDEEHELDFAVLKVGQHLAGPQTITPAAVPLSFGAAAGDPVAVLGYPLSANDVRVTEGNVMGFERGMMLGDAKMEEGNSGGPVVDQAGNLVGVATRIRFTVDENTGEKTTIDYGYGDVIGLANWLDSTDPSDRHDLYVGHADQAADHALPYYLRVDSTAGCDNVVRTQAVSTVYCLRTGARRAAFPDAATFASWFGDFDEVKYITESNLAEFSLTGLVTHKAGTLVKVQTDPRVYLVTDNIGTLRWVTSEALAIQLFGPDWAKKVVDVPETFFPTYSLGLPIE